MKEIKILPPELLSRLTAQRLENLLKVVQKKMYCEGWQSHYSECDPELESFIAHHFGKYIEYRKEIKKALMSKNMPP